MASSRDVIDEPGAWRSFSSPRAPSVRLGLAACALVERGGSRDRRERFETPLRAFVALGNRARALTRRGYAEAPIVDPALEAPRLAAFDAIERYASTLDPRRSLPRQELAIARGLERAIRGGDPRPAEALATLALSRWPSACDVEPALAAAPLAPEALHRVLARELARERRGYPRELVRLALALGSRASAPLALAALARTRDPDAWLDVLIEGEALFGPEDAPRLLALAREAPDRDTARMAADIARTLAPRPRRR